jgi:hypothetical protein
MPEEALWGSFFDVEGILDRLGCRGIEGDILEFDCGYGTFTIPAAQRFKGNGRLFGLDIEPSRFNNVFGVELHEAFCIPPCCRLLGSGYTLLRETCELAPNGGTMVRAVDSQRSTLLLSHPFT